MGNSSLKRSSKVKTLSPSWDAGTLAKLEVSGRAASSSSVTVTAAEARSPRV